MVHQKLVDEVIRQVASHFKPTVPDIKKRIERLVADEYLERDEREINVYRYVA